MKPAAYFFIFILLAIFAISATPVLAKRTIPLRKTTTIAKSSTTVSSQSFTKVRFRGDRKAILVQFNNLSSVSSMSYVMSYGTRGTIQAVTGNLTLTGETQDRELLFGTCSHGVCRYDTGITDSKLVVTTALKTGRKNIKTYILKP